MLSVRDVSVEFGAKVALDRVSLDLGQAEILALLGPSGSGKSTLLRAIAGLEEITTGTITFEEEDLAGVPTHLRGFGLMFQTYALFPHLTVAGNVAFGLRMANLEPASIKSRVSEVLEWVGLSELASRRIERLSGGEMQRVALARTLAPNPRLVMLDEPVGALDRRLRERLVEDMADSLRETKLGVIYVTHDHDEARVIADRVALMNNGRIVQTGTYQEIAERPADAWVADFVASS
ncbi:MAG TPA: ABC transporter ATP-binding protein [Acidimicrobiia bacterium]|jgi:ABC-type Fe3+/spermidine/putrescine transport system ATPase subunit